MHIGLSQNLLWLLVGDFRSAIKELAWSKATINAGMSHGMFGVVVNKLELIDIRSIDNSFRTKEKDEQI